jgi:hypothetical protein
VLREHQARFLLERAEQLAGRELKQIRGKLKTKRQVRHGIWELVLLDAASRLGKINYEPDTSKACADTLLDINGGVWLEAAYLEARHTDVLNRQETFTAELHKTAIEFGPPSALLLQVPKSKT